MKRILFGVLGLSLGLPLLAVQTQVWQVATFQDFLHGHLSGVSLSEAGTLTLAPEVQTVFNPNEALALSMAADKQGNVYLGTGHQGKVFRVAADGKGSLFFTADEPDIFALAVGPDGNLYVGSSPEGKIYRVATDGTSSVFYQPGSKYIWALAFGPNGRLYVGTGDQGKIFEIDPAGKGKVFFESHQTHMMCLAFDGRGNLLAGSAPNGLVFRIDPQGKAFVLYQSDLQEIHSLVTDDHGHIYAAALGAQTGIVPAPMLGAPLTVPSAHPQIITVMAETGSQKSAVSSSVSPHGQTPQKPSGAPSFNRPAPTTIPGAVLGQPSAGQGALIVINPDATVDTLWRSNQESIFGLALRGRDVLFSTGSEGQIYELQPSSDGHTLTLVAETHESMATRLLPEGTNLYVATSNIAKLLRLRSRAAEEGTYESEVKDTKFISHWGELAWRADTPPGASLVFYTRSGNFERPDETWSNWSGPYRDPNGSSIQSPPARYIQWKAVLHGTAAAIPTLDEVSLAYLNQNLPPEIHSLTVSTVGERTSTSSPPPAVASNPAINLNMATMSGISFGQRPEPAQGEVKIPITFSWQADDPNGDSLLYSLYVKSADEKEWHLLKGKLHDSSYTLSADQLPGGKYVARLVASDEESNPPATARTAEMLSEPFWVDNMPPTVRVTHQQIEGGAARVQFEAHGDISPLHSAQVSVDGQPWQDIESDDGIIDSQTENFTVQARPLKPGEHVIILRAYDTAGNAGLGQAVVEIPPASSKPR